MQKVQTAIRTSELRKDYKKRTVVDSIDLDIRMGEAFALLGVNGAGKTTTIKMLSCIVKPTAGDAEIMGHSILTAPDEVKKLISVSPQETAVAPNLTVRENLQLIYGVYGHGKDDSRKAAALAIERYGLAEIASQKAKTLSGGWQRRLSIAMALICDPSILFLDEPTLGLDVLARRELWKVIEGLKGKMTVILTTHYLEEAEALCDRIAVMVKGRIAAVGTSQELIAQTGAKNFENAFVSICEKGAL